MLLSTKELDGYGIAASDGDIGHVREVYFDDDRWVIRHIVAATGGWFSGRDVLLSPHSVDEVDRVACRVAVNLSRQQIKGAPDIDTDKPVSRQHEISYYDYYRYPYYWGTGVGLWGTAAYPMGGWAMGGRRLAPGVPEEVGDVIQAERESGDPHLRSSSKVIGYHIEASDGDIGHIDDFLFDERSWAIRYAVVDTRNWLPDRLVLVSPELIESVDWSNGKVRVKLPREAVKSSPPYERGTPWTDEQDQRMRTHFSGWW